MQDGEEITAAGPRVAARGREWNRGSMCRPRVQRVASACALTSSLSRSLFSLSLSLSLSFPLLSSSVPLVSSGSLIRRVRGDNSSPSLSLDDSLNPPARSFPPPAVASRPPPIVDRASLVSFPPMNVLPARQERQIAISFVDCRQAS